MLLNKLKLIIFSEQGMGVLLKPRQIERLVGLDETSIQDRSARNFSDFKELILCKNYLKKF